jgi:hypothetical protein
MFVNQMLLHVISVIVSESAAKRALLLYQDSVNAVSLVTLVDGSFVVPVSVLVERFLFERLVAVFAADAFDKFEDVLVLSFLSARLNLLVVFYFLFYYFVSLH